MDNDILDITNSHKDKGITDVLDVPITVEDDIVIPKQDKEEEEESIVSLLAKQEIDKFITKGMYIGDLALIGIANKTGLLNRESIKGSYERVEKAGKSIKNRQEEIENIYTNNPTEYTTSEKLRDGVISGLSNPLTPIQLVSKMTPLLDIGVDAVDILLDETLMSTLEDREPNYIEHLNTYGAFKVGVGAVGKVIDIGVDKFRKYNPIEVPSKLSDIVENSKIDIEGSTDKIDIRGQLNEVVNSKELNNVLEPVVESNNFKQFNAQSFNFGGTKSNSFINHDIDIAMKQATDIYIENLNTKFKEASLIEAKTIKAKKAEINKFTKELTNFIKDGADNPDYHNYLVATINNLKKDLDRFASRPSDEEIYKLMQGVIDNFDSKLIDNIVESTTPAERYYNNLKRAVYREAISSSDLSFEDALKIKEVELNKSIGEFNLQLRNGTKGVDTLNTRLVKNATPAIEAENIKFREWASKPKNKNKKYNPRISPAQDLNIKEISNTYLTPIKEQQTRLQNFYITKMKSNGKYLNPSEYAEHLRASNVSIANILLEGTENTSDEFIKSIVKDGDLLERLNKGTGILGLATEDLAEDGRALEFVTRFGTDLIDDLDFNKAESLIKYSEILKKLHQSKDKDLRVILRNITMNDSNVSKFIKNVSDNNPLGLEDDVLKLLQKDIPTIEKYYSNINTTLNNKINMVMRKDRIISYGEQFFELDKGKGFVRDGVATLKKDKVDEFNKLIQYLYSDAEPILNKGSDMSEAESFYKLMFDIKSSRHNNRFGSSHITFSSILHKPYGFVDEDSISRFLNLDETFKKSNEELIDMAMFSFTKSNALFMETGTTNPFKARSNITFGFRQWLGESLHFDSKGGLSYTSESPFVNKLIQDLNEGFTTEFNIRTRVPKSTAESTVDNLIRGVRVMKRTGGGYDELLANPLLAYGLSTRYSSSRSARLKGVSKGVTSHSTDIVARFLNRAKDADLGEDISSRLYLNMAERVGGDKLLWDTIESGLYKGDAISDTSIRYMREAISQYDLFNLTASFDDIKPDLKAIFSRNGVDSSNYPQVYKVIKENFDVDFNKQNLFDLAENNTYAKKALDIYNNYVLEQTPFKNTKYWNKGGIFYKLSSLNRGFMRAMGSDYASRLVSYRDANGYLAPIIGKEGLKGFIKELPDTLEQTIALSLNGSINNMTRRTITAGIPIVYGLRLAFEEEKAEVVDDDSNMKTLGNLAKYTLLTNNPILGLVMSPSNVPNDLYKYMSSGYSEFTKEEGFGKERSIPTKLADTVTAVGSNAYLAVGIGSTLVATYKDSLGELTDEGIIKLDKPFYSSITTDKHNAIKQKLRNTFKSDKNEDIDYDLMATDLLEVETAMEQDKETATAIRDRAKSNSYKEITNITTNSAIIADEVLFEDMLDENLKDEIEARINKLGASDDISRYYKEVIYKEYKSTTDKGLFLYNVRRLTGLRLDNVNFDMTPMDNKQLQFVAMLFLNNEPTISKDEYNAYKLMGIIPERLRNKFTEEQIKSVIKREKKNLLHIYR